MDVCRLVPSRNNVFSTRELLIPRYYEMFHCNGFANNEKITVNVRMVEADLVYSNPVDKYQ